MHEHRTSDVTLREEKARLHAILNTTVDAIITIDDHGVVQDFNIAAEKIFGYNADEMIGQNVALLMPSPYRESHDQFIANYLRTGKANIIGIGRRVNGLRKSGETFPVDLAVSEFQVGDRRMFTGVLRDISSRDRLERAIVATGENVRREIGRDLHDILGQQLTGISLLAKTLEKQLPSNQEQLQSSTAKINQLAREAMTVIKRLSHGLYSTVLQRQGLSVALAELADTQQRVYEARCTFEAETKLLFLDQATELNLYRIAQEAVHNAVKHSKAQHISIHLTQEDENLLLRVKDDGIGISKDLSTYEGMGLAIMRHRAQVIGATFGITQNLEGGTLVTCVMPRSKSQTSPIRSQANE